ncbi:TonB-dependent siderophore receptor [Rhizobacter sp. LjRoot28]|uniref:TonB-dependent siderophore receptor n=1 Tax=Rhizobacter sp. LjRoot28 TaxID=3342309 RepID=UPI003ECC8425
MTTATTLAQAQAQSAAPPTTLQPLVVKAQAPVPVTGLTGFGDVPLVSVPMQTTVIGRDQLEESQARRLADILVYEASATDAYNSPGYWDYISVRGFTLDQRHNYRREGLPISAETVISLRNKERVEILKGTSGIQSGTSSPGGIINYIVKRPTTTPLRQGTLSTGERGNLGAAIDLSDRAGQDGAFGYRLNFAYDNRKPDIDHYDHLEASLAALAVDWRIAPDSLLEAEVEWSRQVGKSLPGHSLTGDRLPSVRGPDNLNNQPWSLPNRFDGVTGTLRFRQGFGNRWSWLSELSSQQLETDDRLAYPYGFNCGVDGGFCDRYGPNGEYDVYDFRSENERRRTHVAQTALQGKVDAAGLRHTLNVGVQYSRRLVDANPGSNNYVGTGNIDGSLVTPADPTAGEPGTDSREHAIEWFATDAIDWGHGITTWLGLRHTRMHRFSVGTDGADPLPSADGITTPWVAGSYEWRPRQHVYLSWGEGAESYVVPGAVGQSDYTNGGQVLTAKTKQWELGTKGEHGPTAWNLAYFDVNRPHPDESGATYRFDGGQHHRGIDGNISHAAGPWQVQLGAMLLKARREGAAEPGANGRQPVNVPKHTLRAQVRYRVDALPGLGLMAHVAHEGRRNVLDDGSIELPSWTRTDIGASYAHKLGGSNLTWNLGVRNVFDRRAWKESPTQFGHVYLFPMEARTVLLSLMAEI